MKIPFWKTESVGNDFVLVHLKDAEQLSPKADIEEFLRNLAVKACERKFGIGSDGLLVVSKEELDERFAGLRSETFKPHEIKLRMFNPDGTEDFCGNGVRCAILHGILQNWTGVTFITVHHHGRTIVGQELAPHERMAHHPKTGNIRFQLDSASYEPASIPIARGSELFDSEIMRIANKDYHGSVLSTGTCHTIIPVAQLPGDDEFLQVSPIIENAPLFPERTSVIWVQEIEPMTLKLRIWERGAGETLGCGTGSAAAAIDYLRRSGTGGIVKVENPGGELRVEAADWQAPPMLYGTAAEIFQGEFLIDAKQS